LTKALVNKVTKDGRMLRQKFPGEGFSVARTRLRWSRHRGWSQDFATGSGDGITNRGYARSGEKAIAEIPTSSQLSSSTDY
jgi:hypothetical protein